MAICPTGAGAAATAAASTFNLLRTNNAANVIFMIFGSTPAIAFRNVSRPRTFASVLRAVGPAARKNTGQVDLPGI